jgi:hypothetical protein
LFEALVAIRASAQTIKILRNNRVIGVRQGKPIDRLIAIITRVSAHGEIKLRADVSHLGDVFYVSDNHIRAMHQLWRIWTNRMLDRWHEHRCRLAINQLIDLDRLHRRADGDCSSNRTGIRRSAKGASKFF